ncbi:MAG TPA: hypothetical protein VKG05_14725 [Steroidobacteraceae bacterium]|nr:hypothetical protein [Steroidobacteraceae bacterium]
MRLRVLSLVITSAVSAASAAGTGSAPPPPPPPTDESFIEFLGSDDVGDAAWWEFLKNADPRAAKPPPPPPTSQGTKQ